MRPLRIEIDLVGALGRSAHPIHLDSLVAYQLIKRLPDAQRTEEVISKTLETLPFQRAEIGGDWVWTASSLAFSWTSPPYQITGVRALRAERLVKDLDVMDVRNEDMQIDTSRGKWKSEQWAEIQQQASRAVAYAIGDKGVLQELLEGIETLGARRRFLTNSVTDVRIEDDAQAESLWQCRYLPKDSPGDFPLVEGAYRLPLHDRRNQTIVADNSLKV